MFQKPRLRRDSLPLRPPSVAPIERSATGFTALETKIKEPSALSWSEVRCEGRGAAGEAASVEPAASPGYCSRQQSCSRSLHTRVVAVSRILASSCCLFYIPIIPTNFFILSHPANKVLVCLFVFSDFNCACVSDVFELFPVISEHRRRRCCCRDEVSFLGYKRGCRS